MNNPYSGTLAKIWKRGQDDASHGIHNPPQWSGVNIEAIIAYQRGWESHT